MVIKILLMNGFDASAHDGYSALVLGNASCEAVKIGDKVVTRFPLRKGVDINCGSPIRREKPCIL